MNSASSTRLKQIGFWGLALILGLICGRMIHSGTGSMKARSKKPVSEESSKSRLQWDSPMSQPSRYLWRETAELRDPETYQSGVARLYRDSRSPLRAVSVISHRIQYGTFEECAFLIAEGKVKRLEALREVGDHLARLDAERAIQLIFNGPTSFDHLEQFYTFRNSIFDTITERDPELILKAVKRLPRGGSQMDSSRYFSEIWANRDPSAVAARFDELQELRNMSVDSSSAQIPYEEFAGILMKSWVTKDADQAAVYVESLPAGAKRDALQAAFNQFSQHN